MAYNVEENSIAVIYNGVDINLFRPEATPAIHLVGSPPQPYIVSVGSYIPRKGHRSLLDAFAKVVKRYPSLGLVIVGMDGPERAKLLERAKILELGGSVTLLVNAKPPEVAVVVAGATLCVQPSTAEPFGLAVIEAGACGVPVLVTAVGGHVELITDRKNGFLFAVGDVVQCAETRQCFTKSISLLT